MLNSSPYENEVMTATYLLIHSGAGRRMSVKRISAMLIPLGSLCKNHLSDPLHGVDAEAQ
jgi:hypothetical protein